MAVSGRAAWRRSAVASCGDHQPPPASQDDPAWRAGCDTPPQQELLPPPGIRSLTQTAPAGRFARAAIRIILCRSAQPTNQQITATVLMRTWSVPQAGSMRTAAVTAAGTARKPGAEGDGDCDWHRLGEAAEERGTGGGGDE